MALSKAMIPDMPKAHVVGSDPLFDDLISEQQHGLSNA
jgi:hypothetical protein